MIQLATRIPKRLHRAMRLLAIEEGTSVMAFVSEALAEQLARCQTATGKNPGRDSRKVTAARRKVTLMPRVSADG